jgi:hypothetical protein
MLSDLGFPNKLDVFCLAAWLQTRAQLAEGHFDGGLTRVQGVDDEAQIVETALQAGRQLVRLELSNTRAHQQAEQLAAHAVVHVAQNTLAFEGSLRVVQRFERSQRCPSHRPTDPLRT